MPAPSLFYKKNKHDHLKRFQPLPRRFAETPMSSPPAAHSAAAHPRNALDTPPSSDVEPTNAHFPPSPPLSPKRSAAPPSVCLSPVDRLLGILLTRTGGRLTSGETDWRTFRLTPAQYAELNTRIQNDENAAVWRWYEDKCRYDYDPDRAEYVLRMPSHVHEFFIARVEKAIEGAVEALAGRTESEDGARGWLSEVFRGRSPTLELHVPRLANSSQETVDDGEEEVIVRRSPDATFYHRSDQTFPALVLEVSYSQQRKDLPRLAESYIVDSRHQIRCVVGLDIPYSNAKKAARKKGRQATTAAAAGDEEEREKEKVATLSIWRPGTITGPDGDEVGVCRTDVDSLPFRNAPGSACSGSLNLTLSDFLPGPLSSTLPPTTATEHIISISFADLAHLLTDAEQDAAAIANGAVRVHPTAPKAFRKRKRSPSEELSDEREKVYARLEEAEVEREAIEDEEWKGCEGLRKRSRGTRRGRGRGTGVEAGGQDGEGEGDAAQGASERTQDGNERRVRAEVVVVPERRRRSLRHRGSGSGSRNRAGGGGAG